MAPPVIRTSTAASLPEFSLGGLDTALLRRWLDEVFADFYDGLFDASFAESAGRQVEVLAVLRQARAQQAAIVDETTGDLALLLAEPGAAGVVIPIGAARGTESARNRLWQRRLLDAFLRRCARLSLGTVKRDRLESAFERRLLVRLEQVAAGTPAAVARAAPEPVQAAAPTPRSASEVVPPEQIEKLVSRFRAGGLKLMLDESEVPAVAAASSVAAEPAGAAVQARVAADGAASRRAAAPDPALAQQPRASSRRALLLLVLLGACALWVEPRLMPEVRATPPPQQAQPGAVAAVQPEARRIGAPDAATAGMPAPIAQEHETTSAEPPATTVVSDPVSATAALAAPLSEVTTGPAEADAATTPVPALTGSPERGTLASMTAMDTPEPPVVELPAPAVAELAAPGVAEPPRDARLLSQVAYLLQRGDKAVAELRLTEPFADSAAANYLAVLAIDPGNELAQQGLTRVVERYAALVRAAHARGDSAQAELLLGRARSVLPHVPQLEELTRTP